MAAFLRLIIFGALFLTAVYFILYLWSRSVRADRLRREWEETGRVGDRDTYVQAGLERRDAVVRRRLVVVVYVIPAVVVISVIYVTNFL